MAPFFMQIILSRAPGNIVDWVYKMIGVKYSFAAHLRDTGTVSLCFQPPNFSKCLVLSQTPLVWFCSPGAMDTTCRRRNGENGRILG